MIGSKEAAVAMCVYSAKEYAINKKIAQSPFLQIHKLNKLALKLKKHREESGFSINI
jgi:hypothetical protein